MSTRDNNGNVTHVGHMLAWRKTGGKATMDLRVMAKRGKDEKIMRVEVADRAGYVNTINFRGATIVDLAKVPS